MTAGLGTKRCPCPGQVHFEVGQVNLDMYLPEWQAKIQAYGEPTFQYVGIGRLFCNLGDVNFVFRQVKVEDHLPGDRQYLNLNVEPWVTGP